MATLSFAIGALAFGAFVALSLLGLRLWPARTPLFLFLACGLTVHLAASLAAGWAFRAVAYWHAAALYWFAFMGYLYAYSALQKSISLRTLRTVCARAERSADLPALYAQVVRRSFLERADLLVQGGMAAVQDGRYAPTARARKTAERIASVRRLFGVVSRGLYFDTAPPPSPHDEAARARGGRGG